MANQLFTPNGATSPNGDWATPLNALPGDGAAYSMQSTSPVGPLVFSFPVNLIPAGSTIQGIEVGMWVAINPGAGAVPMPTPGFLNTLTAQFSKDGGSTWVGDQKRTSTFAGTNAFTLKTLGGASDPWGVSWTAADLNSSNLRVRVWRPSNPSYADEDMGFNRTVESLTLTVYYTAPSGGGVTSMPDRLNDLQYCVIGKEVTRGTAVAPTQKLKAAKFSPQPVVEMKELTAQGDLVPYEYIVVSEMTEATLEGNPAFDEIGWYLASIVGKPVTSTIVAGAYRHQFNLDTKAVANVQTYTGEYRDGTIAEKITNMILAELGLNTARKDHSLSGKFIGRNMLDNQTPSPAPNEVQSLNLNSATAITLRFRGATTPSIATPTAANVQSALQALTEVGAGGFVVTGTGTLTITAGAALAGQALPLIEVVASTGGAPSVTRTTPGNFTEDAAVPMLPGKWGLYYDAVRANLGTTPAKLTKLHSANFQLGNRFAPVWVMDPALESFSTTAEDQIAMAMKVTVQADAIAAGMAADSRARVNKYARLENIGGPIAATGQNYTFQLEMACRCALIGNFKEDQKIYAREFDLKPRFDSAWGQTAQIVLINDKASY